MATQKRQQRIWWAMAGAFGAATLAGLVSGELVRLGRGWPPAVLITALSVILLLAFVAMIPLWGRLDEMARDAHTTAWYWGGSAGLGIGLLSLLAYGGVRNQMFQGAALTALLELAGYGIFWLGWWAMRRTREA